MIQSINWILEEYMFLLTAAVSLFIGAAIPIFTLWINVKLKEKYFRLEMREKLKTVAIEKRLEAHQTAFTFWFQFLEVIHNNDNEYKSRNDVTKNALTFWQNNSLYLEKETREEFRKVINIVRTYSWDLDMLRSIKNDEEKKKFKKEVFEKWETFMNLYKIIQKEVELTPLKPQIEVDEEGNKILLKKE